MGLSGMWQIAADPDNRGLAEQWYRPGRLPTSRPAQVPGEWETALGIDYDGIAWYRRHVAVPPFSGNERVLLRFDAVATEAQVWINGTSAGRHTGPWTPFVLDVTDLVKPGGDAELVVRADEKVGHNTQGFLPIIAPHFGGIWQDVSLVIAPALRLDELRLVVDASQIDPATGMGTLHVEIPIVGSGPPAVSLQFALRDRQGHIIARESSPHAAKTARWTWSGKVRLWDFDRPNLYRLSISLLDESGTELDGLRTPIGFRQVSAEGPMIRLNGHECIVRDVLNWGFNPPHLAPNLSDDPFREQLRYFKACGFNLIKFCLWLPPQHVLQIMDEEGMLAWVEYPTWHPKIDAAHRDALVAEYEQMTAHDGNHPSVILRSITCETGPSADLDVIRELYELIKQRCPGTLVVDDSSWIGWNRIHDFWDDHAYGNNRSWRDSLRRFEQYIETHGVKPFIMGEAIAADTWPDAPALAAAPSQWAWCLPRWLDAQVAFEAMLRKRFTTTHLDPVASLRAQSLRYAMEMRRWQIETYRHQMPHAGYVVSTMQDVKLCAMGLLDTWGRPKWPVDAWAFDGTIMTPLNTPGDCRGFPSGSELTFDPCYRLADEHNNKPDIRTRWSLAGQTVDQDLRNDMTDSSIRFVLPDVTQPQAMRLERMLLWQDDRPSGPGVDWTLWVLPEPAAAGPGTAVAAADDERLTGLFDDARRVSAAEPIGAKAAVLITTALTPAILDYLEAGGNVLHLTSNRAGSFKQEGIWFLRGTAWAPPEPKAFFDRCPQAMLGDLQLFDLGGQAVIRGELLWEQVDPLLTFIETHDLKTVRPNLLLFDTAVGRGRLIVSALHHEGGTKTNYAGWWLAHVLVDYLQAGPRPQRRLTDQTIGALRESLSAESRDLDPTWRFMLDPKDQGTAKGYFRRDYDDSAWRTLQAASAQEGEVWNRYDGWGWYRRTVKIDKTWNQRPVRIVFDSVDDMYQLYVNGRLVGGHGRLDRSETSFLRRTWLDVTEYVEFDRLNTLAVRVHDWVGAGGLNGKVWLTTGPVGPLGDLLQR